MKNTYAGSQRSGTISTAEVSLPIFMGPVFDPLAHRVQNWVTLPGERGFPGLDAYGWGLHPNGMIDCINLPGCKSFDGSEQTWEELWRSENLLDENLASQGSKTDGHTLLLRRCIVRVLLNPLDPGFCPDPKLWEVRVPFGLSQATIPNGSPGRLVLKNQVSKGAESNRLSKFTERDGPWSNKVGLATWLKSPSL